MQKLLKLLSLTIYYLFINLNLFAQCTTINFNPPVGGNPNQILLESRNGEAITNHDTLRILLIFFEVQYTNPLNDPTNSYWLPHTLPPWVANSNPGSQNLFLDVYPPTGHTQALLTEYYREASSNHFTVLGDYLVNPTNGGVFSISQNDYYTALTAPSPGFIGKLNDVVNAAMNGNFVTGSGLNVVDFDKWKMNIPGAPYPSDQVHIA